MTNKELLEDLLIEYDEFDMQPIHYQYCLEGGEYNEEGLWQPNKTGLGMRHVFDELNKIYGKGFIRYE